ncbi:MAG: hypothetical protein AAGH89_04845 [Verrucomicrobiota bacterium]
MKTRPLWIFTFGLVVAGGFAQGQQTSSFDSKQAQVTLPYSEVKELWKAAKVYEAEPEEVKPPVPAVVRAMKAELGIGDDMVQLSVRFEVESFAEDWHSIPLIGGDAQLVSVVPEDASVVWGDNGYVLLRDQAGPTEVSLEFSKTRKGGRRESLLELETRDATVQILTVEGIPKDRGLELNGVPLIVADGIATTALPKNSGSLKLGLIAAMAEATKPSIAIPSSWELSSQILTRYADGALQYEARVFAQDRTGDGETMALELPKNARNVAIRSDALASSRPTRNTEGTLVYQIGWEDAGTLDRELEVGFEIPISPLADAWPLFVPKAEGGESEQALFVIPLAEGLEVDGEGVTASAQAQRISPWFQDRLGNAEYVSLQASADVQVEPRWLPRRSTAQATISAANFETQLERNGQTLNRAIYTIDHDSTLVWQTSLPDDCEVLKCTVNDRPVMPVARDERTIELTLTPCESCQTEVALQYAHRGEPMADIEGNLMLNLPETPLFIHNLAWELRIPGIFVISAVDGNLEPAASSEGANSVSLLKQLCQGEAPMVEVFYRRPAANE